jgi:peptidoglycan hydrolase-like amidase
VSPVPTITLSFSRREHVAMRRTPHIFHRRRRFMASLLAVVTVATSLAFVAEPAAAQTAPDSIKLEGRGFGHGRGMSQFGSLGYAVDFGWTYQQIVDHYYSNTTFGDPIANDDIKVHLTAYNFDPLAITSGSAFTVAGVSFAAGESARLRVTGVNTFAVDRGGACAGSDWTNVSSGLSGTEGQNGHPFIEATVDRGEQGDDISHFLRICADGNERAFRGALRLVEIGGQAYTLNRLPMEQYLRGVVPRESPSFWGTLGGGKGLEALKAQSVAARSYAAALALRRQASGFASDTCDTQACQVYGGAALNGLPLDHGVSQQTTNAAIAATAGQVRRFSNGAIASTEFASSTGGWTATQAEGNGFPAVEDLGDNTSRNTNHTWTKTISRSSIEAAWPAIGTLQRIEVPVRNGLGDLGGRVRGIDLIGSNSTVKLRFDNWGGDVFRRTFGLLSDWYTFSDFPTAASQAEQGLYVAKSDGTVRTFGSATFRGDLSAVDLVQPIVGMSLTESGDGYWLVASDGGVFAYGDATFHGSTGDIKLDKPIVGMATVPGGGGYWLVASDGGVFSFGAARFYGSMGGVRLKAPVVGIAPAPSGAGYWMVASDGGIFAFGSAPFHGSTGNLKLAAPIVSMVPSVTGRGYWFVASDGGVFNFGDASFLGSRGGRDNKGDVVSITETADGGGYWIVTESGISFPYGTAVDFVTSIVGTQVVAVRSAR